MCFAFSSPQYRPRDAWRQSRKPCGPTDAHPNPSSTHAGLLQYEAFPWGITGERFRALAAGALREIGPAPRETAWP